MEIIMAKEKHSGDKITEQTLHEILVDIKYRLNHLEDITADDRQLLVKLVKQNNTIVEYLKSLEVEILDEEEPSFTYTPSIEDNEKREKLRAMVNEFLEKKESLKELEEELKKNADKITPGQVGEA